MTKTNATAKTKKTGNKELKVYKDVLVKIYDFNIATVLSKGHASLLRAKYYDPHYDEPVLSPGDKFIIVNWYAEPFAYRNEYYKAMRENLKLQRTLHFEVNKVAGDELTKLRNIISEETFGKWRISKAEKELWELKNVLAEISDFIVSNDELSKRFSDYLEKQTNKKTHKRKKVKYGT